MIARHLQHVSRQPAPACDIPTAPDFITTFQCLGQFILNLFTTLDTTGFAALGDLAQAMSNFIGGEGGLLAAVLGKINAGT